MKKTELSVGMRTSFKISSLVLFSLLLFISGCKTDAGQSKSNAKPAKSAEIKFPVLDFNPDSAYYYIEKQVNFGPRVPNTEGHKKCAKWLADQFRSYNISVKEQDFVAEAWNGTALQSKNIIAKYRPERNKRILLCAHWDTRPYSDSDMADPENFDTPIDGANDAGSGVGVLLEVARQLSLVNYPIGVDFVLFDSEDYGQPDQADGEQKTDTWCLGSQYWSKSVVNDPKKPVYGILLDMVGAKDAIFTKEGTSMRAAPQLVHQVWSIARKAGYAKYFSTEQTKAILDDHYYVNTLARIPTIDIIQFDHDTEHNFGHYWHTQNDNMDIIDKETLEAVGQTIFEVISAEIN